MKKALVFNVEREGYGIDQIRNPMTAGQLREMLEELDDDMLIICSHDSGYTYGSLSKVAEIREEREGEYGTEYETIDEVICW